MGYTPSKMGSLSAGALRCIVNGQAQEVSNPLLQVRGSFPSKPRSAHAPTPTGPLRNGSDTILLRAALGARDGQNPLEVRDKCARGRGPLAPALCHRPPPPSTPLPLQSPRITLSDGLNCMNSMCTGGAALVRCPRPLAAHPVHNCPPAQHTHAAPPLPLPPSSSPPASNSPPAPRAP